MRKAEDKLSAEFDFDDFPCVLVESDLGGEVCAADQFARAFMGRFWKCHNEKNSILFHIDRRVPIISETAKFPFRLFNNGAGFFEGESPISELFVFRPWWRYYVRWRSS